jgi:CrcB protein
MGRVLMVGLGGAIGSVARYWLDGAISNYSGGTFPFGILVINVTGSFIIGVFFALFGPEGRWLLHPSVFTFLTVGICGGYTTFSSFSLLTLRLAQERQWLYAGANVLASIVFCLLAVWLGYALGASVNTKSGS